MPLLDSMSEIQVAWQVDNIDVLATLTRPIGFGPFPAVAMVAGSGPTDRNWNTPLLPGTNGSAALLAQTLTAENFMTLRYDKRASGPNVQANMQQMMGKVSMQGHLEELAGGVRLLAARQDVDSKRLFALTSSEGCIHALNYQLQAKEFPFAGLVLTGAPARSIGEVARGQIAALLAPMPGGEALLATYDDAMEDFAAERPVKVDESLPESVRSLILGLTVPHNQPFARELWTTNPAVLAAKITVPILIVIGKKDLQVDWQADGNVWESLARDHPNIKIVYPDNANHVLKHEPKPREQLLPAEITTTYNADGIALDPQVVETILSWLHDQE